MIRAHLHYLLGEIQFRVAGGPGWTVVFAPNGGRHFGFLPMYFSASGDIVPNWPYWRPPFAVVPEPWMIDARLADGNGAVVVASAPFFYGYVITREDDPLSACLVRSNLKLEKELP